MSYLQTYQRVKAHREGAKPPLDTNQSIIPASANQIAESTIIDQSNAVQARFSKLRLTSSSAQSVINSCSDRVQTLDLSHNRMDTLPTWLPTSLVALNLSKNHIERVTSPKALFQLIELNLSRNRIKRIQGLAMLINLQYLDVSSNFITIVEGLESMKDLKVLKLDCNLVSNMTALRPLSYNRSLTELCISDNPVSEAGDIRVQLSNLLPNLKFVDGEPIRLRPAQNASDRFNYVELSMCRPHPVRGSGQNRGMLHEADHSIIQGYHDASDRENNAARQPPQAMDGGGNDSFSSQAKRSALPWRNPPNPLPRPWKGKQLFASTPLEADTSASPINYHLRSHGKAALPPSPPPPLPPLVEDTVSTVYEEDGPDTTPWLCPALNRVLSFDGDDASMQDNDYPFIESDDEGSRLRRSRSPGKPLRSPHTKASLLRAHYTAEKLHYLNRPVPSFQPTTNRGRARKGTPNRSRRNPSEPSEEALAEQPATEDITAEDLDISMRSARRSASPYRLLTQLKGKIDRRFRGNPSETPGGRSFEFLHSFPAPEATSDPFMPQNLAPGEFNELQAKRQAIEFQLQQSLSPSALGLLGVEAAPPSLLPTESNIPQMRGAVAKQSYAEYGRNEHAIDVSPSILPDTLLELSDLHLLAAGDGLASDEAKNLSRAIEALKARQLHTLAALQVVTPLQALAAEPISPSAPPMRTPASAPPSAMPAATLFTPLATNESIRVPSAMPSSASPLDSSVVPSEITQIFSAMEDLRQRQQRSLASLQSNVTL